MVGKFCVVIQYFVGVLVSNEGFVRNFIFPIDRVGHFFEVMSVMFREL
jgi:hypothetical protein